jgi:MoxR-like ATPase
MQEQQVTIGKETHLLHSPFLVMATQNPVESEGTYPLPEAQLDRFMMKLLVDYPTAEEELLIVQRNGEPVSPVLSSQLTPDQVLSIQQQVDCVYLDPALMHYIVSIVRETRTGLTPWVSHGASPRGAIALARSGKALALFNGRTYVTPDDITRLIHDCLRHRIILSYEALMDHMTPDMLIDKAIEQQPVPVL